MKNVKFVKRIFALLMTIAMVVGTSVCAFAAESNNSNVIEEDIVAENNTSTFSSRTTTGAVIKGLAPNTNGSSSTHLDPYIAVSKSFEVSIASYSGSFSGSVLVYLRRNSDNKYVASWELTAGNLKGVTNLGWAQSGDYTLLAYNNSTATVNIVGGWD